ncbi:MAG: hypothetical protein QY325_05650 [Flavobacteriales bacterium]|jgi:hypothetical protein|nr:MAG: hypothetical protein QY325_05650 [Flavobacteriales bacterium]
MRTILLLALLLGAFAVHAQSTIYSFAIGNWRNGPTVYITPLIETTEAATKPKLKEEFRARHAELKDINDMDFDVLLFGTREEGEEHRASLKQKYGIRKLEVVMLSATGPAQDPAR